LIIDGATRNGSFASYAALGLAVSLNPSPSGGWERAASVTEARTVANEAPSIDGSDPTVSMSGGSDHELPKGLGRIVKDEAGQIIAVETNDNVDLCPPDHRLDLVDETAAVAAIHAPVCQRWTSFGQTSGTEKPNIDLILCECGTLMGSGDNRFDLSLHGINFAAVSIGLILEARPDIFHTPVPRFSSNGKLAFLQRLISKHGRDVAAMMRDRKLNPDQRTEGEIRRAIRKAGGVEKLGAQMS
jgi:nucleolar protein 16